MYSVEKNTIKIMHEEEVVVTMAVWFMTPMGLTDNLEEALEKVKQLDFVPELTIRPVAVAISEHYYEVVSR